MTSRETSLQLKIDHFLKRGEECCAQARYPAARRMLDAALALDPAHEATLAFGDRINREFSRVVNHDGITTHSRGGQKDDLIVVVDQDERVLTDFADVLLRHGFRFAGAATYLHLFPRLSAVVQAAVSS